MSDAGRQRMSDGGADGGPERRGEEVLASIFQRYRKGEIPDPEEIPDGQPELTDEIRGFLRVIQASVGLGDGMGQESEETRAGNAASRRIGGYRLIREVGHGAMGVVYEAEQEPLGRRVALKVLPFHALLDERQLARFQREARSAARLHHTNIVPVYDVGEVDSVHYYAMQFIDGRGLDVWIEELSRERRERRPAERVGIRKLAGGSTSRFLQGLLAGTLEPVAEKPETLTSTEDGPGSSPVTSSSRTGRHHPPQAYYEAVARVGLQVVEALSHAHGEGVFHRDIKPSNLLVDSRGTVWVTDFGLAKDDCTETLTHTGDIVGTLAYMAPESLDGRFDARSDLYSLGLTLYELLVLRPAFRGTDRAHLVKAITETDPVPPRRLDRHVPRDLETIIDTAASKDPARRYQSAQEMARDLRSFLNDRPIQARRATALERVWRWCRRKPATALLILVLLLGAGAVSGLAWVVYHQRWVAEVERLIWTARTLYADGQYSNALVPVDQALKLDPDSREARLLNARLLYELEDFNGALGELTPLTSDGTARGEAHYLLAAIYRDRDEEKARFHRTQAERFLPDNADAFHLRSLMAPTVQQRMVFLTQGLSRDPSHFSCRLSRALARYSSRDYAGAAEDAGMALVLRPRDVRCWMLRALARRNLGLLGEALRDHQQAVPLAPLNPEVYNQRRETFHLLDRHAEELEDAEKCLELDSQPLLYSLNRMSALLCLGDLAGFHQAWDSFRTARPDSKERALAWLQKRAIDLLEQGDAFPESLPLEEGDEAVQALERARRLYFHLQAKAARLVARGFRAAWSPDGKRLAYTRGDRTAPGLYEGRGSKSTSRFRGLGGIEILNLETGEVRLLTASGKDPSWSPDGRQIAFVREPWIHAYHEEEVWVVPVAGGAERRLAVGGFPLWSRDSTRVLFHDRSEEVLYSIRVDDRDAAPVRVLECPGWYPAVSPDGRYLAYSLEERVFVVELDTGKLVQTWTGPRKEPGLLLSWSSDGRELGIGGFDRSAFGLWILDLDSGVARKVLDGPITLCAWSPDRTLLAFDVRGPFFEIWIASLESGVMTAQSLGCSAETRGVPGPPRDAESAVEPVPDPDG